jgi:hypothetical protein
VAVRQRAPRVPLDAPVDGEPPEAPPLDTSTFELRYRYSRARRNAKIRQRQETRLARIRFYLVLAVLVAIAIAFVMGSWHEIQHVFGL